MKTQLRALVRRSRPARTVAAPLLALRRWLIHRKAARAARYFDAAFAGVEAGSLVVRADAYLGTFEIDFRSHVLRRLLIDKAYEAEVAALARQHLDPTRDVVDVGANVGLYSVLFAKLLKGERRVLAVEPAPLPRGYLLRNLERNGCAGRVTVYAGLATDRPGTYHLNVIPGMEEFASLGGIVHEAVRGHAAERVEVQGETVDGLVARHGLQPGFVKIDTEGAEYGVLAGARETLRTHRPVLLSELDDALLAEQGHTSAEVVAMLRELGYDVFDAATLDPRLPDPFKGEVLALPRR